MHFFQKAPGTPLRLGILAGTFNPPTRAHLALGAAALRRVDEVVFVLPRAFPHKPYEGANFDDRVRMLLAAVAREPRFSIASAEGGLFIEIARECRAAYGPTDLTFLCGRDAAERIVNWDYGEPGAFRAMLEEFGLLVASRQGSYAPAAELATRIHTLEIGYDECSASAVREHLPGWEHLVPTEILSIVREIYPAKR